MIAKYSKPLRVILVASSLVSGPAMITAQDKPVGRKTLPDKPAIPKAVPSIELDFSQCSYQGGKLGKLDKGKITVVVTFSGEGGPYAYEFEINCSQGISANAVCVHLAFEINTLAGGPYAHRQPGGLLQIVGIPDYPLESVAVILQGTTTGLQSDAAGGARCIVRREDRLDETAARVGLVAERQLPPNYRLTQVTLRRVASRLDVRVLDEHPQLLPMPTQFVRRCTQADDPPAKKPVPQNDKPSIEFKRDMVLGNGKDDKAEASYTLTIKLTGTDEQLEVPFQVDGAFSSANANILAIEGSLRSTGKKGLLPPWKCTRVGNKLIIEGWTDPKTMKFYPVKTITFTSPDIAKEYWPTIKSPPIQIDG